MRRDRPGGRRPVRMIPVAPNGADDLNVLRLAAFAVRLVDRDENREARPVLGLEKAREVLQRSIFEAGWTLAVGVVVDRLPGKGFRLRVIGEGSKECARLRPID